MRSGLKADAASTPDVVRRLPGKVPAGSLAVMEEAQCVEVLQTKAIKFVAWKTYIYNFIF
jgi:hypothetical protein